ncbi:VOC family protein [Cohnella lupini]|uniref:Glyoxalase/bleomycin resistance protein/dioxygenase superfamily protein n=1 Tax=Cohnella lupini TaxID=1294267 RepID=A0A3D9HNY5_9BACL|nr:VOC family protein [Cohnella lupini]RED51187.1 glyoxalase/bleomycin resistance protein/dioxygenase superfamily protein [Cohnella lupini]
MSGVLGTNLVAQVGLIVKDVEETKKKWAELLGVDVPPTQPIGDYAVTGTEFKGKPAPNAYCWMAFFNVGPGLQLELIQPNDEPSTWRNYLEEKGEGIHHIAFQVKDSKTAIASAEAAGLELVQRGVYGDGSGEYNYFDAPDLKCVIEILESYKK